MQMVQTRQELVVLDFETSGMAPHRGDRAIEVGAVKVFEGRIVDRFESLMNPGFRVSSFIEEFTGITNEELRCAPACEEVMQSFFTVYRWCSTCCTQCDVRSAIS